MDRMGSEPNLSVKRSVSIGTMLNFDGDGHGDGDGTCKQAFNQKCSFLITRMHSSRMRTVRYSSRLLGGGGLLGGPAIQGGGVWPGVSA